MKESLKLIIGICTLLIVLFNTTAVLADNSSREKAIALTINWMEDTPQNRPESITVELYRHVDGEDVPMDSKTLSSQDSSSSNTWSCVFEYYYGPVWEYAFKITSTVPKTALYSYRLVESGNGTNHYTFDFYHESGETEMRIETVWEGDDQSGSRPEQYTAELVNIDTGEVEREVVLTKEDNWGGVVSGLNDSPSTYYLVVKDLPNYSSVVTRGESANTYVCVNTYTTETAGEWEEIKAQESLSEAIGGIAGSVNQDIENSRLILRRLLLILFVIAASIVVILVIKKLQKSENKNK